MRALMMIPFAAWMTRVNAICEELTGIGIEDLPDQPFALWHEKGMAPITAAKKAIRYAGGTVE